MRRSKPVYCRLMGPWNGSGHLYWSTFSHDWTFKDNTPLIDLRLLEEPLPKGTTAIEITDYNGNMIAAGAALLDYWKRRYIPGWQARHEAKDWIKANAPKDRLFVVRYTCRGFPSARKVLARSETEAWEILLKHVAFPQWHEIISVRPLAEADEQLPLLKVPASYKPGTARKFVKGLASPYKDGEHISRGAKFRRLVGQYSNKGVYIWDIKSEEDAATRLGTPWRDGRIVVVLSIPNRYHQGPGPIPYTEWPIAQDWASFSFLKDSLRTWRNLQGSKLFINGVPAGEISYRNPHLQ